MPTKVLNKRVLKVKGTSGMNVDEYTRFFEAENNEIQREKKRVTSAICIQRAWKGWKARRRVNALLREQRAAIFVQKRIRIWIAKRKVERKRRELKAAILLQSMWRGHRMRKLMWKNMTQMRHDRLVLRSTMKIQVLEI